MPKGRRLPKIVRVTAALDPDVAALFQRMSEVSGVSLSRTIGAWCGQTADGIRVVLDMMSKTQDAPRVVMSQFYGRATSIQDGIDQATYESEQAEQPAPPAARPGLSAVHSAVHPLHSSPRPVTRGDSVPNSGQRRIVPHSGPSGKGGK